VTSRFDWYLDRVVHFDRSGTLTVNHDVVRATSDLGSDCFMRLGWQELGLQEGSNFYHFCY
jgi:hypothetical protein